MRTSLAALLLALALAACSSSKPQEMADPDVAPRASNPDGVPYPTANLGSAPGSVAPNLAFQGYPDSNRAGGLQTISLADYFDPKAARHKLLYLSIAALWCSSCAAEAADMAALQPKYAPQGVLMIEVIVAGSTSGYGPSLGDVDAWVDQHKTTWTVLADVRGRRTGASLGLTGVPSSMLIDPRTMTIIHESPGAPNSLEAYLKLGLDWVGKH